MSHPHLPPTCVAHTSQLVDKHLRPAEKGLGTAPHTCVKTILPHPRSFPRSIEGRPTTPTGPPSVTPEPRLDQGPVTGRHPGQEQVLSQPEEMGSGLGVSAAF